MSPEMLNESGHGRMNDLYSLGCLLYEFLNGLPPFYNQDWNRMFEDIVSWPLTIPKHLSESAWDLLWKLLNKNPWERLGFREGIKEIKEHPFCSGMNFKLLQEKRIAPPFVPSINESYFDNEYLSKHLQENPENYLNMTDYSIVSQANRPTD